MRKAILDGLTLCFAHHTSGQFASCCELLLTASFLDPSFKSLWFIQPYGMLSVVIWKCCVIHNIFLYIEQQAIKDSVFKQLLHLPPAPVVDVPFSFAPPTSSADTGTIMFTQPPAPPVAQPQPEAEAGKLNIVLLIDMLYIMH